MPFIWDEARPTTGVAAYPVPALDHPRGRAAISRQRVRAPKPAPGNVLPYERPARRTGREEACCRSRPAAGDGRRAAGVPGVRRPRAAVAAGTGRPSALPGARLWRRDRHPGRARAARLIPARVPSPSPPASPFVCGPAPPRRVLAAVAVATGTTAFSAAGGGDRSGAADRARRRNRWGRSCTRRWPGLATTLAVFANMLGDTLRDLPDCRLRRGC
jgi:hypothetical protein